MKELLYITEYFELKLHPAKLMSLTTPLDAFDKAILRILQKDSKRPHHEIGELVNLSAPSVQRRVKRMEKEGVITSVVSVINPALVGLNLTIIVEIELLSENKGKSDEIQSLFLQSPEIQQCYYVAGEIDFILIIVVSDMKEYEELTKRLFFSNQNINKFRTFVTMDRTITSQYLNI